MCMFDVVDLTPIQIRFKISKYELADTWCITSPSIKIISFSSSYERVLFFFQRKRTFGNVKIWKMDEKYAKTM